HSGLLAERGTLGFAAYVSVFAYLFKRVFHASRNEELRSRLSPDMLTMTAIAPYVMIAHVAFSFSTYYWINWIFWVHHGLVYAIIISAYKSAGMPMRTIKMVNSGISQRLFGVIEAKKTP
ncbi:MAG: hypothetical protein ACK5HH_09795, partial [Ignavibacteria bacterium]